ncbi:MAG TPA: type II toxin-antitoxin system PemK/MazF family toxin [Xanthobacteraceae bacterium]
MGAFKPWDVVKVPFPYADRPVRQRRPALVLTAGAIEAAHGLVWVLMITSAENRRWDDDVAVSDLDTAGLPAASVVRCAKIATIEAQDAERIGELAPGNQRRVADRVIQLLAGALALAPPSRRH